MLRSAQHRGLHCAAFTPFDVALCCVQRHTGVALCDAERHSQRSAINYELRCCVVLRFQPVWCRVFRVACGPLRTYDPRQRMHAFRPV